MSITTQESGTDARTIVKILIVVALTLAYSAWDDSDCVQADGTISNVCNGETK